MAPRRDLFRESKINALRRHALGPPQHAPAYGAAMSALLAAKARRDLASARRSQECLDGLWRLHGQPVREVLRYHAGEVRRASLLANEVRPEDVVLVELVDGWGLVDEEDARTAQLLDASETEVCAVERDGRGSGGDDDDDDGAWGDLVWVVGEDNNSDGRLDAPDDDDWWWIHAPQPANFSFESKQSIPSH